MELKIIKRNFNDTDISSNFSEIIVTHIVTHIVTTIRVMYILQRGKQRKK